MHVVTSDTIKVPGARLHYEAVGQGPLLLIIPGGPQDAGVFAGLAQHLADRYRVVAYDPRGNSRSRFDGDAAAQDMDVHGDDAAALIAALGDGPAYVFGTSGGAQIGLNLAARHPHRVKRLIAHEPPTVMLLDDPAPVLASNAALQDTYRRDGIEAAMGLFFAQNGLDAAMDGPPPDMPPEAMETFARVSGNFAYWLADGVVTLSTYKPDLAALRADPARIVVALGEGSVGQPIHAMGIALANRLGVPPAAFPGDHMGFETDPAGFAAAMARNLVG